MPDPVDAPGPLDVLARFIEKSRGPKPSAMQAYEALATLRTQLAEKDAALRALAEEHACCWHDPHGFLHDPEGACNPAALSPEPTQGEPDA